MMFLGLAQAAPVINVLDGGELGACDALGSFHHPLGVLYGSMRSSWHTTLVSVCEYALGGTEDRSAPVSWNTGELSEGSIGCCACLTRMEELGGPGESECDLQT